MVAESPKLVATLPQHVAVVVVNDCLADAIVAETFLCYFLGHEMLVAFDSMQTVMMLANWTMMAIQTYSDWHRSSTGKNPAESEH